MEQKFQRGQNHFNPNTPLKKLTAKVSTNYTFETFIEGDCNRLALKSALQVAEEPGEALFNPLIIFSETGLGKTHLAQAVYNKITGEKPDYKLVYIGCEEFCNQYIEAIKNNNKNDFLDFYLQLDVLLIDDLQYLEGKSNTQESLTKIFDHLYLSGKQMVFITSVLPIGFLDFNLRLKSRVNRCFMVTLKKPEYNTRCEILKKKAKQLDKHNVEIPENVLMYIAERFDSNVRELECAIVSILGTAIKLNINIDLEFAKSCLKQIGKNK